MEIVIFRQTLSIVMPNFTSKKIIFMTDPVKLEILEIKKKITELRLRNILEEEQKSMNSAPNNDASIFVGKIDPKTTKENLEEFFSCCGEIVRTTIITDPFKKIPRHAFIEFKTVESAQLSLQLNDRIFLGHNLKIVMKRDPKKRSPAISRKRRRTYKRRRR